MMYYFEGRKQDKDCSPIFTLGLKEKEKKKIYSL